MGSERDLDDRIHQVEGDDRAPGLSLDQFMVNDLFGSNDQPPGGTRQLKVVDHDPVDLCIPKPVAAVNVEKCHVGIAGGNQVQSACRSRGLQSPWPNCGDGVGAQHGAHRHKRHTHGRCQEAPLEAGVADLAGHFHLPGLDRPAAAGRQTPQFMAEGISHFHPADTTAADENVDVVDGGLADHGQVAFALADNS